MHIIRIKNKSKLWIDVMSDVMWQMCYLKRAPLRHMSC